ncbi:MAG TPA: GNAT family N-acetyltransferase [Streptosporangiaceae bacterium]|nr:GNAT family N-acetyltransferase [Streptosporangiaceae bacterium]
MALVRATALDDWQAMREIRLQALKDAPDAFASTYAREAAFEPAEWHRRATRDGSFLAFIPGLAEPAGLVGGFEQEPGVAEVVSMFVRPQARGHGVGEALIDAVTAWAKDQGATSVHLWVTDTNKRAIRLYERCGFTVTPERQPLPSNPALGEVGMTRPL